MNKAERKDLSYSYNSKGYMIQYKGQNIGGAGTNSDKNAHWKIQKKDRAMYKQEAETAIDNIVNGHMHPYMQKAIDKINSQT